MNKKRIVCLAVFLLLLFGASMGVLAGCDAAVLHTPGQQTEKASEADAVDLHAVGQQTKEILQGNNKLSYLSADGEAVVITQQDIKLARLKKEFLGLDVDEQDIIDQYIRQRVVLLEAVRLGLDISWEQARENQANIIAQIKESTKSDDKYERENAQQVLSYMEDYIDGLGLTEEEYLDFTAGEQLLLDAAQALQDYFKAEHYPGGAVPATFEADWNAYVDELVAAATVEIEE